MEHKRLSANDSCCQGLWYQPFVNDFGHRQQSTVNHSCQLINQQQKSITAVMNKTSTNLVWSTTKSMALVNDKNPRFSSTTHVSNCSDSRLSSTTSVNKKSLVIAATHDVTPPVKDSCQRHHSMTLANKNISQDKPTNPNATYTKGCQRLLSTTVAQTLGKDSSQQLLTSTRINDKSQRLLSRTLKNLMRHNTT